MRREFGRIHSRSTGRRVLADATATAIDNPVINSPFAEPERHFVTNLLTTSSAW